MIHLIVMEYPEQRGSGGLYRGIEILPRGTKGPGVFS